MFDSSTIRAMNERTYSALLKLKEAIQKDPRLTSLKEAEKALNDDPAAIKLSKEKDALTEAYEDALFHYGENSEVTKAAWHNLYIRKKELDELPSSESYRKAYAPLAQIYRELDLILFSPYREKGKCGGKI